MLERQNYRKELHFLFFAKTNKKTQQTNQNQQVLNIRMKVAGKCEKAKQNKTKTKTKKSDPNSTTTRVRDSWSNLKDTPGGIMEFNTASK